eukprot:jgi/Psemu1/48640/gm1.48640_g
MDWSNSAATMGVDSNGRSQFHLKKRRKVAGSSSTNIPSTAVPQHEETTTKVCDLPFPPSLLPSTSECFGDDQHLNSRSACHQSQTPDTFMHSGNSYCMPSSYSTTVSSSSTSLSYPSEVGLPDFITSIPPIPNFGGIDMEGTGRGKNRSPFSISRRSSKVSCFLK